MMKILLLVCTLFLLLPQIASAHIRGVPITKMNGKDSVIHPVQAVQSFVFNLPADSDIAPENYLVGQPVETVIDTTKLPVSQEIFEKANFIWDFGDGSAKQILKNGTKNSYQYKKQGTYLLTVQVDYAAAGYSDVGIQQIQATVLHILPYKEYKLPKPIITINGEPADDTKNISLDLNNNVTFAVSTTGQSGKRISYKWNLDDGNESDKSEVSHRYKLPQYYATPIVRATDENGFFVDDYVVLKNSGSNEPNDPEGKELRKLLFTIGGSIFITFLLIGGGLVAIKLKKH